MKKIISGGNKILSKRQNLKSGRVVQEKQYHCKEASNVLNELKKTKSNIEYLLNILKEKSSNGIVFNNEQIKQLIKKISSADITLEKIIKKQLEKEQKNNSNFQIRTSICPSNCNWIRGLGLANEWKKYFQGQ